MTIVRPALAFALIALLAGSASPRGKGEGAGPAPLEPHGSSGTRAGHSLLDEYAGPLSDAERRLFLDAGDGRWDQFGLLSAALTACAADQPERWAGYDDRLGRLVDAWRAEAPAAETPAAAAARLHARMHRDVLQGGYRLSATSLAVAFDEGAYNCVSATVLFQCLADRAGLDVASLESPGHALSRLRGAGRHWDIETTCPEWFRLQEDPRRRAERVAAILGRPGAEDDRRDAREISAVQLVAMIYYNRAVDFLGQRRFRDALAANAKAIRLDPQNASARGNFLATLNNWAISLGSAGRHGEAAALLEQGIGIERGYWPLRANYVHVHREWTDALCRAGRVQEAMDLVDRAAAVLPEDDRWPALRRRIGPGE